MQHLRKLSTSFFNLTTYTVMDVSFWGECCYWYWALLLGVSSVDLIELCKGDWETVFPFCRFGKNTEKVSSFPSGLPRRSKVKTRIKTDLPELLTCAQKVCVHQAYSFPLLRTTWNFCRFIDLSPPIESQDGTGIGSNWNISLFPQADNRSCSFGCSLS